MKRTPVIGLLVGPPEPGHVPPGPDERLGDVVADMAIDTDDDDFLRVHLPGSLLVTTKLDATSALMNWTRSYACHTELNGIEDLNHA